MTNIESMKLALDALELHGQQYPHMVKGYCIDAIAALRQAISKAAVKESLTTQEQPAEQEPVAHVNEHGRLTLSLNWNDIPKPFDLYTAPPQQGTRAEHSREWVSLTDEEKMVAYCKTPGLRQYVSAFFAGAEWADAKLKEKNT